MPYLEDVTVKHPYDPEGITVTFSRLELKPKPQRKLIGNSHQRRIVRRKRERFANTKIVMGPMVDYISRGAFKLIGTDKK